MTRTNAARTRGPGALVVALALAASASVGALPLPASATGPLDHVVVMGTGAAAAVVHAGGQVLGRLPLVGGVDALVPRDAPLPRSLQVAADRPLSVASTGSASGGSAAPVRDVLGLGAPAGEGAGVTVAVVDTGVADGVADLAGRVEHVAVDGVGSGDGLGHGTFIAGLVAGSGAGSGGRYAGVAPAAHVLDVKVAEQDGTTSLVSVLRGLQVAADHHVDVVNLSLSSGSPLPAELDPLAVALDRLWADGVTVVVPSGNVGDEVSSPGSDPLLLTLGGLADGGTADRRDDAVADWSGRSRSKPDLVAPGASLVSLLAPGSAAESAQGTHASVPAGYGLGSGTSFATAVASGAAAALLGERPALSPGQVKDLLTGTAYRARSLRSGAGSGGLDLAAALAARTPKDRAERASGSVAPADAAAWQQFVAAVLAGDAEAAASSWSRLSPQTRTWVARQWAGLDEDTRAWAARQWAARQWAGQEWLARQWAARQWAARQWATGDWTARQWADDAWTARQWASPDWTARQWAARQWAARQWAARQWAARDWS